MSNGNFITIVEAQRIIRTYAEDEAAAVKLPKEDLAVANLFDLSLLKTFMQGIDELQAEIQKQNDQAGEKVKPDIKFVRIYRAKNKHSTQASEGDRNLVILPVFEGEEDCYEVFKSIKDLPPFPLILSNGTPCPNVCQKNARNLPCVAASASKEVERTPATIDK